MSVQFTPAGPAVRPTRGRDDADTWQWGLKLTDVGYGDALSPVPEAELHAGGNRIEYRRGSIVEWYINDERGVEQGFTLTAPPACRSDDDAAPLTLLQEVDGGLHPRLSADRRSTTFFDGTGRRRLAYRDLYVVDAVGRKLPCGLAVRDSNLAIEVDDREAVYPIIVDPLIINEDAKLITSDIMAQDGLGRSVSISGDTVVLGAEGAGSAYVFVKPDGGWSGILTEHAKLNALDGAAKDLFGSSVAISGDTIVVGARRDDDNGFSSGSVYVFEKPEGGWSGSLTEAAKLLASDGAINDRLGQSVSISGDTVIAGTQADAAYVFEKPAGGWSGTLTEQAKLTPSDGGENDDFGISVSISGETIVVGAEDNAPAGSTYVFVQPDGGWNGNMTESAKLVASDGAATDQFGRAVSIFAETVVVGARFHGGNNVGAAYVFEMPERGWSGTLTENAKLTASDGAQGDTFGSSASIFADTIVLGADTYGDEDTGAAYLFEKPESGWSGDLTEDAKLVASDASAFARLGTSASIFAGTVVVGAGYDSDNGTNSGSAYVFDFSPACAADVNADGEVGVTDLTFVILAWGQAGGAADINGDGLVDVLDLVQVITNWGPCV